MNEFENKKIQQQRWIIIGLIATIILVASIKINGFNNLTTMLVIGSFAVTLYILLKKRELHTTGMLKDVQKQYREDVGHLIDVRDYMQGSLGDKIYFYFPQEFFGLEYDTKQRVVTAKMAYTVSEWLKRVQDNVLIEELAKMDILNKKKEELMEEKGYVRKD